MDGGSEAEAAQHRWRGRHPAALGYGRRRDRSLASILTSRGIIPPLLDATLIEMRSGLWTLTGFERVPDDALGELVAYQQSWLVMPRLHAA
jgi:hypothetical protein